MFFSSALGFNYGGSLNVLFIGVCDTVEYFASDFFVISEPGKQSIRMVSFLWKVDSREVVGSFE